MAIAPRSAWEDPAKPVTGPAPKAQLARIFFHWPGSNVIASNFEASCASLRQMQASYLASRGYSLGYSWAITRDGFAIEVRGDQFNNAANAGRKVEGNANNNSRSILMFNGIDSNQNVTPAQISAVHELFQAKGYGDLPQFVHSDVDYTGCAGPAVTAAVRGGVFVPGAPPTQPPPTQPPPTQPPPPVEGEDMLVNLIQYKNPDYPNPQPAVFAQYSGGYKIWVESEPVRDILMGVSGISQVAQFDDNWFVAAGPILPGTPLPYPCDEYGRKTF